MTRGYRLLAGALALSTFGNAWASSIVFSDLGGGAPSYSSVSSFTISGRNAAEPAFAFTNDSWIQFSELDIALETISGTNSVVVDLMSDSGGAPGSVLQSWTVNNLPAAGTCCAVQSLLGNDTIDLDPGIQYWVAVLPFDASTVAGWNQNNIGATADLFENHGSGFALAAPDSNEGAFEVLGTTPEPATGVLALIAGFLILFRKLSIQKLARSRH